LRGCDRVANTCTCEGGFAAVGADNKLAIWAGATAAAATAATTATAVCRVNNLCKCTVAHVNQANRVSVCASDQNISHIKLLNLSLNLPCLQRA
jgi:hypothetical protein